jgi:hypothetical protein
MYVEQDRIAETYLIKGLYKIAEGWQEAGKFAGARCIYRFINCCDKDEFFDVVAFERAQAERNLAQLTRDEYTARRELTLTS